MSMKQYLLTSLFILPTAALAGNSPVVNEFAYTLDDTTKLKLNFQHANIDISHDSSDEITLIHKQQVKKGDPEKCLYRIDKAHKGSTLTLSNERENNSSFFNFSFSDSCNTEQKITIVIGKGVVEKFTLDLGHSNTQLDQSSYEIFEADIAHSKLDIGNVTGKEADIELAHSKAFINTASTESMELDGAHSLFEANDIKAKNLSGDWAHSKSNIKNSDIDNVIYDAAHSGISFSNHAGNNLELSGSHSHLYTKSTVNGEVTIENRHGGIEFIGSPKSIATDNAHGNTKLTLLNESTESLSAYSSHGSISVQVPNGSHYSENIQRKGSKIYSTKSSKSTVNLKASHGSVNLKEEKT